MPLETDETRHVCTICGYLTDRPDLSDLGTVHGNTRRFRKMVFHLWKCPRCQTIHSTDPVDFQDLYTDYPLNERRLDFFARVTMGNLLKRLKRAGFVKTDSILDFGCGNGLFVQYLKGEGFTDVTGYDPYVAEFSQLQEGSTYGCVIANDVVEHASDPRAVVQECAGHVKAGGLLYIGVPDSEGVAMRCLEPHVMRLHQPFHRTIFTQDTLRTLGLETGFELVKAYRRSYMDTLVPFANYRFLDECSKALDHDMDMMLQPRAGIALLRSPSLWFYAFFGYLFPSAYEPAVVLRRPF